MKSTSLFIKTLAPLLLSAGAFHGAAQAADVSLNRLVDLNIPSALYGQGCENLASQEGNDKSLVKLQNALCTIHSNPPVAGDRPEQRKRMQAAAVQLAGAQTSGLTSKAQNFAVFLEGIANCRVASNSARRTLRDATFCPTRVAALTSFQNVNWSSFAVNYRNSDGSENPDAWNKLVSEMASCYENVLAVEYDASCGVSAETPNLEQTITGRVSAVFQELFESSKSPVDAIIKRKIDSSSDILKRARKSLWGDESFVSRPTGDVRAETLLAKASFVAGQTTVLDRAIDDSSKAIDALKADYRDAILAADQIQQEYNRLKDGIYVEAPDKRWADLLAENQEILKSTVQSTKKSQAAEPSAWDQLANLPDQLNTLLAYADDRKGSIRSLCQIYFCELMSGQNLSTNGDTSIACRDTRLKDNPLCASAQTAVTSLVMKMPQQDGSTSPVKVADLCREAGFGKDASGVERFLKLGMPPPERTACFKQPI